MSRILFGFVLAAVAVAFTTRPADASIIWEFGLDGDQEVPPVVTSGSGTATITYDQAMRLLTWDVDYTLDYLSTNAHFHGPASVGVNAGVTVGMTSLGPNVADTITQADLNVTSGSFVGSHTLTEAQEAQLLDDHWYINIHSQGYPAGEIRGQVVPEPASLALLGLGGLALLKRRRLT